MNAGKELALFRAAIHRKKPAVQLFTHEALMFMFLAYGASCLASSDISILGQVATNTVKISKEK